MRDNCTGRAMLAKHEAKKQAAKTKGRWFRCRVCKFWHVVSGGKDKMCSSKARYSYTRAHVEADRLNQKAYRCPHCARWHLASR